MQRVEENNPPLLRVDEPHSCTYCQKIVIKEQEMKGWNFMTCIPHTKTEARRAAAEGCPLFQLFAEAFKEGTTFELLLRVVRALFMPTSEIMWAIPPSLCRFWYDGKEMGLRVVAERLAYVLRHIRQRHLCLTFSGPNMFVYYLMWRNLSKSLTFTAFRGELRNL